MSSGSHNKNTDAEGKRFSPSAYKIEHITMRNHRGEPKNIENIVVKFSITESLYSPTCVLSLSIKDSVNFFESFPCIGQETVTIQLGYKEHESGIEKSLNMKFFVVEYPTYGRAPKNNHVQVYRLRGISEQAYISSHKKISRSYSYSKTTDIIQNILERDCNLTLDEIAVSGDSESKIKWNCPYMTPFSALEYLRSRSYDTNQSPYYLFQSVNGKMNLISHSAMTQALYGADGAVPSPVYQTYFDARQFSSDPSTTKDYAERATRIIECSSNIKLAKVEQSRMGAFTSENYSLDYTNKSYTQSIFTLDQNTLENTINKQSVISDKFTFSDGVNTPTKTPLEFTSAHCEYIPINSGAFIDDLDTTAEEAGATYTDLSEKALSSINSYRALANNTTHDILLHGDLGLNPGKKVQLQFPKALDPEQLKEYLETDEFDVYDKALSGKYFIATVEHRFQAGEYYCNCRVKRDSMSLELS